MKIRLKYLWGLPVLMISACMVWFLFVQQDSTVTLFNETTVSQSITRADTVPLSEDAVSGYFSDHHCSFFPRVYDFLGIEFSARDPVYIMSFRVDEDSFETFIAQSDFKLSTTYTTENLKIFNSYLNGAEWASLSPRGSTLFGTNTQMLPAFIYLYADQSKKGIISIVMCIVRL